MVPCNCTYTIHAVRAVSVRLLGSAPGVVRQFVCNAGNTFDADFDIFVLPSPVAPGHFPRCHWWFWWWNAAQPGGLRIIAFGSVSCQPAVTMQWPESLCFSSLLRFWCFADSSVGAGQLTTHPMSPPKLLQLAGTKMKNTPLSVTFL
mmetsp:Transcript_107657/g.246508  ORF Transcript_107657/g.246508 Transcript_107657/m.246508 type:complete len:147 (+) Transcript_107657:1101-1541(+)